MKKIYSLVVKAILSFLLVVVFQTSFAQQDTVSTDDLLLLSFGDLMNMEITVASTKAMSQRESPGIVSVITAEEIQTSGARDLIDVLRLVPGIDFGLDVSGTVGMSIRGNWGHDGKILMMVDGIQVNELAYSTLQFGNHYSVDQIKRIEIIRGPGSSIYGGNAEFGVINIITHQGDDINGISVTGTYGQMEKNFGRRNLSLSAGKKINDFEFSLHGFVGQGNRSDQVFTDIFGDEFDLSKGGAEINPTTLNVGLGYKGLSARVFYDNYKNKSTSLFDAGIPPGDITFSNLTTELKYDWEINEKFTLTPKFNYTQQSPWSSPESEFLAYSMEAIRIKGNLTGSYDINENVNIVFGGEYYGDDATYADDIFYNGKDNISYSNTSAFAQALIQTKFVNMTFGGRYDIHSEVDAAFSPRIGLTKAFEKFHFKLLYSHAFRTPGIENMNLVHDMSVDPPVLIAPEIKPEKTVVTELELGYNINSNMMVSANLFNIENKDPIVYFFYEDEVTAEIVEGYFNATKTGSRGVEFEYRVKDKWGYVNFNYSFYTTKNINEVSLFEVPDNENQFLAFPQHKLVLNSNIKATEKLNIAPSFVFRSTRYTYRALDVNDVEILSEENPIFLLNLYVSYRNLFTDGLTVGAGVYDLLGQKDEFFQAYNQWHAPWPGPSREFVFKLKYDFKFD